MNEKFLKDLVGFLQKKDQPCPIKNKPPKRGVRVHTIPEEHRPFWVLGAELIQGGFKAQGEVLTNMLARQAVARIEAGMLFAESPTYVFCDDWCVYTKAPKATSRTRRGGF